MNRRRLVASLAAAPLARTTAGLAQGVDRPPRIGVLMQPSRFEIFKTGLRDLGYRIDRDISLEFRSTERRELLNDLANELVGSGVNAIVAGGSQASHSAQRATRSIPIIMAPAGDPVGTGLVASLSRPGANITGLALQTTDTSAKRLDLLREIVPGLGRLGILVDPEDQAAVIGLTETTAAARSLGVAVEVAEAQSRDELPAAAVSLGSARVQGLIVVPGPLMTANVEGIAAWALVNRVPSVYALREFPQAGGLMSYGPRFAALVRRSAVYVDRILKGANPAELPVEQPTVFDLVLNLRTARALDLTLPQSVLARAAEAID